MPEIRSPDGTRLSWQTSGSGPGLLLVHGTTSEHKRWRPILAALSAVFTVHALDRRGRGDSGDAPGYAIEREFADVAAVADAIGAPVTVLGHSYGAICALEATRLSPAIDRLVLYEPPIVEGPVSDDDGVATRLDALIADGDREGALLHFYRGVLRAPEEQIAAMQAQPNWPDRLALAHTIARELRSVGSYRFVPAGLAATAPPTLLLLGGESLPRFRSAIELLGRALPKTKTVVLPGQRHQAIDTAPSLFAKEVLAFLTEETGS